MSSAAISPPVEDALQGSLCALIQPTLRIGFGVAVQIACFAWKYWNIIFVAGSIILCMENQTIREYVGASALACGVVLYAISWLWNDAFDTGVLVALFLWNYWNLICATIAVFFILAGLSLGSLKELDSRYNRVQSPQQQQRQHEASNSFSYRRISRGSSNRNNHDHGKHKHDTQESAETEVRRLKKKNEMQQTGCEDNDRLNTYYNSELCGWFVGRSSRR